MTLRRIRRGLTLIELMAVILIITIVLSLSVHTLGTNRRTATAAHALGLLAKLGQAHALYAADWHDRQVTWIVDDFSRYGDNASAAFANYQLINGQPHPWMNLGLYQGAMYALSQGECDNYVPFTFDFNCGSYRFPNAKAFHDYVGGRFYEEHFYTPTDTVNYAHVEPWLSNPSEYIPSAVIGLMWTSSFCLSPAAMFSPDVMRAPSHGGWQNPWLLNRGFARPSLSQARYPDLKTHMMEARCNQNAPPDVCNPATSPGYPYPCDPYLFNHGLASSPATLFYDGHVRLLPNSEVIDDDAQVMQQTGVDGLWSRDTPLGPLGFFGTITSDGTIVSHHILTTDGILGRDALSP